MKTTSLRPKTRFGSRLASLRREQGLSQAAFAKEFSDYAGRQKELTVATVSSWETSMRLPDISTMIALARFFNVSLDYMHGLSNDKDGTVTVASTDKPMDLKESIFKINEKDILKYDSFPVFVVFKNLEHTNQWGIVDAATTSIILKSGAIKLTSFIGEFFTYPRPADVHYSVFNCHAHNIKTLMNADKFWIELKSCSNELNKQYSGWWRHNETKTGIINPANGLTLPYEGLGISYNAYTNII